jgi:hypothetical protein
VNPDQPVSRARNRLILAAITLLFVAPIFIAWLLTSGVLNWHSRGFVNRGQLVAPPIDLTPYAAQAGFAPLFKLQPSDWAMVYLEPGACALACGKALDELLVLRELLGQGAVRVSVHAIAALGMEVPRHAARVPLDPAAIELLNARLATGTTEVSLPAIVLVDWRHQLMLRYAPHGDSAAIQKDLKRLLRASAIR